MPHWLDAGRLRSAELDRRGALALHRAAARPRMVTLWSWCSRLGDGLLWACLLVVLPLVDAAKGRERALMVAALGAINLAIYYGLKRSTRRMRPYQNCQGIRACAKVPDAFSFPSGHALHAVAYALLLSAFYPALAPLLWVVAVLVSLSRVALGLHYPSDVLVGALIGACTASLVLLQQL